jgi:hypothetical protein
MPRSARDNYLNVEFGDGPAVLCSVTVSTGRLQFQKPANDVIDRMPPASATRFARLRGTGRAAITPATDADVAAALELAELLLR